MRYTLIFLLLIISAPFLQGQESPDPVKIMETASIMGKAPSFFMEINMSINTAKGSKERTLEVYYQEETGEKRNLIQISAPSFLRKMKFLTHSYKDGTRAKWLKTSKGVRRLSDNNSSESLFDSDFTVEDLSDFEIKDYSLIYLGETTEKGFTMDKIEARPSGGQGSYAKKIFYIDKTTRLIRRVEFINQKGETEKEYLLEETQEIEGLYFPVTCRMTTVKANTNTVIRFNTIDTHKEIPAKYFNKGNL